MFCKVMGRVVRLLTTVGLVLIACGVALGQDVRTNYMPGTDFTKFKTYKWVDAGGQQPNQIVDVQIRQAIDSQLAAKGLTKTDDEKADLYLSYQIAVDQERQWNAYGMGGRVFGGMGTATSSTIQIGTLNLDFYDASNKQLVWQGQASKTLDPSNNPEKNQQRINKAAAKLLKKFPPK